MKFKICESDFKFMCVIWDNEPLPSHRLVELCNGRLGWKKSTTYTVLKKLCEKGYAKNENATVSSLVAKEAVQAYRSESIINNSFSGSLPNFLVSFLGNHKISRKEAEELKQLIDSYKEE